MAASIFTRVSGGALYVGMFLLTGWTLALVSGADAYGVYMGLLGSWLGQLVLFGFTAAIFYHLAGGLRHLAWDIGKGWSKEAASISAWMSIAFAILASLIVWGMATMGVH